MMLAKDFATFRSASIAKQFDALSLSVLSFGVNELAPWAWLFPKSGCFQLVRGT